MTQFDLADFAPGDTIIAIEDVGTDYVGTIREVHANEILDVWYQSISTGFDVPINEVHTLYKQGETEPYKPGGTGFPPLPPMAASVPVDKPATPIPNPPVSEDALMPGHVCTFVNASKFRFNQNRLFVVLNWTKNSSRTKVNIAPLNGANEDEAFWAGSYVTTPVIHCQRVTFRQPLHKVGGN